MVRPHCLSIYSRDDLTRGAAMASKAFGGKAIPDSSRESCDHSEILGGSVRGNMNGCSLICPLTLGSIGLVFKDNLWPCSEVLLNVFLQLLISDIYVLPAGFRPVVSQDMKKFFVCLLVSLLFCTLYGESLVPTVRINEIMSSNGATIADDDGELEDWIELYNYGDEVVDLSGWGLSDNPNNPFKWTFPEGTMIAPGEYKLVWASGQDRGHLGDFSPLDLQPAIWLRADVVETVEDGGQLRVSRWQDLSGHSRDATQATATRRPVLWPDGAGEGVPVIRFNGSSHYLQFGENAQSVFSSVGGGAIFAVVNPGTSSGTRVVTVFSNGNNTNYRIGLDTVNSEIRAGGRLKDSNTLQEIRAPLTLGKLQLWGVDANWLGRRLRLFVDGVLAAEKTEWLGGRRN